MKRWIKWPAYAAFLLALVVFALLVFQAALLPGIVRRAVAAKLAELGLPDATLEVRSVSWGGAELGNLRLAADGSACVGSLAVRYSPGSLAAGAVDTVEITGAEVTVRLADGRLDLGALSQIRGASEGSSKLPFRQVNLRSSALLIDWNERRVRIPLEAVILSAGHGAAKHGAASFEGTAVVQGATVRVRGTWDPATNSLSFALGSDGLDIGALLAVLPGGVVPLGLRAGGKVQLTADGTASPAGLCASLAVAGRGLWVDARIGGRRAAGDGITFTASAKLGDGFIPENLRCQLDADSLELDGFAARQVRIGAERKGDALVVSAAGAGAGWKLAALVGTAQGMFSRPGSPSTVEAQCQLEGVVPAEAVRLLAAKGVDVSRLGVIGIVGRFRGGLPERLGGGIPPFEVEDFEITLARGDVTLPGRGLVFRDVSGRLHLDGKVGPAGLLVRVLPESRLLLGGVSAAGGFSVDGPTAADIASIEFRAPAPVRLSFEKGEQAWSLSAPDVAVSVAGARVRQAGSYALDALGVAVRFSCEASGKEETAGKILLLPDGMLSFESAALGGLRLGRTRLMLRPGAAAPAAEFAAGTGGFKMQTQFGVAADGDIVLVAPGSLTATVKGSQLSCEIASGAGLDKTKLSVSADSVSVGIPAFGYSAVFQKPLLDVRTSDAGGPAGAGPRLDATLALEGLSVLGKDSAAVLQLGRDSLRPVSASVDLAARKGRVHLDWPIQKDAPLTADAELDFARPRPAGAIDFACNGYRLAEGGPVAAAVAMSTGLDVAGVLSVGGRLRLDGDRLVPRVTVAVKDGSVFSREYDARAEGISGSATFTSFSPPVTPGGQRFDVRKLDVGKFSAEQGFIEFRIEDDPVALFIERTEWGWADGRLYEYALRIDPKQPRIDLRVFGDGIHVNTLLGLALGPGSAGEGELYGMLPVSISRTDFADVRFGRGFLYAGPGGGWWKVGGSTGAVVRGNLQQSVAAAQRDQPVEVQRKIVDGMLDFRYRTFQVDFIKEKDDLLLRLTAAGRSVDEKPPIEYAPLVIDLPHFESVLRKALIIKTGIGRILQRAEERVKEK